jgi:hypothetical protein
MNFNFKESLNKVKQSKIKYAIEIENSRLQKSFQNNFDETIYNFNKDSKKYTKNEKKSLMTLKKITAPVVDSGNYVLTANSPLEIILQDKNIEYIQNNINKIVNVYQKEYNNGVKASGFGDFIRGTYFLMQFCEKYNIKYDVQINHPLRKYLKLYSTEQYYDSNIEQIFYPDLQIIFFDKTNFNTDNREDIQYEFIDYLKYQVFENKVARVYTISYHFAPITEDQKRRMRLLLEPTDDFKLYILTTLKNMQLCLKNYIVIHIRSGDNALIYNEDVNNEYLRSILIEIYKIYKPQYKYLLLSDSVKLKEKIVCLFPKMRSEFKEITHSGEGVTMTYESIKNTMLDFYLLAYSGRIYSYSYYEHGSGFSRWCAETFNIPYKCTTVK